MEHDSLPPRWYKSWNVGHGLALTALVTVVGCATMPWHERERTTVITPKMRMAAIQEIGLRAQDTDIEEQRRLTEQLATQIQTEPDPIVRRTIQEAIGEFSTPLARDVLIAGLQDDDLDVRLACCQQLGKLADTDAVGALSTALETDAKLDVKLAAVDALGKIKSPLSISALSKAVNDRDPALQYAGVQALKSVSGQELGNDVAAWREYAASQEPEISVAARPGLWSPFK